MKTIDKIRNITNKAIKDKAEQAEIDLINKKKKEKKEREEMIERAKDVSFFIKEIESSAKKGENTYSISLGKKDDSEYDELKKKYIKEYLSDFNPILEDYPDSSCSYNYDGDSIDGTEVYYTSTRVTFNW
jgi:hypothetical protein